MKKSKITLSPPRGGGSAYLKFAEGTTKVRIVSEIIEGEEGWSRQGDTNTVHRQAAEFTEIQRNELNIEAKPKQFYACIVWNYNTEKFECWVMTQVGIKTAVYDNMMDADWGDPIEYDIAISRKGSGLETTYTVTPKPHAKFAGDISGLKYDLTKLFEGGDPMET